MDLASTNVVHWCCKFYSFLKDKNKLNKLTENKSKSILLKTLKTKMNREFKFEKNLQSKGNTHHEFLWYQQTFILLNIIY